MLAVPTASTARADAATFQRFLHAHQYPADCSATVGARARAGYFGALGLGAQMVSLRVQFREPRSCRASVPLSHLALRQPAALPLALV